MKFDKKISKQLLKGKKELKKKSKKEIKKPKDKKNPRTLWVRRRKKN